jgi:hypothetical protein
VKSSLELPYQRPIRFQNKVGASSADSADSQVTSRIWFTLTQRAELWERWTLRQSISWISRVLER